jgi:small subunit ribosomal protein S6
MRTYELMIITNGRNDEPTVQSLIERFTGIITERGGSVHKVDHWGKRQFAYEIEHMTEGYYTVIDFDIDSEGLFELERRLRLTDDVVRHKVVRPAIRTKRAS